MGVYWRTSGEGLSMTRMLNQAALAAVLLVGLLTQGAMARSSPEFYGELRIGPSFVDDADFEELGVTGELSYENGVGLDLAFGAYFDSGIRLE
jgi:hypothetical protein